MITVEWVPDEETYIVEQDGEFVKDDEDLHSALKFALAVAANDFGDSVIVRSIENDPV